MNQREKAVVVGIAVFAALPMTSMAQAQPTGPDRKKLDYFVGKWKTEVEIKATATSKAAKASGTDQCEWFANAHVVCRGESTGPSGPVKSMRLLSPLMAQFASYSIDSTGYVSLSTGDSQGDTWTFTASSGGLKARYVIKASKDSYSAVSEYSGPDGKWTAVYTVSATRTK